MSKKTLNLSVEESIKNRAKRIARQRGISVSRFFEEMVIIQDEPAKYSPKPDTAAYRLSKLIPESEKTVDPDYDKMKYEALKEKYNID